MCYRPIEIEISPKHYVLVNCRQCLECRQARAKEWSLRCMFATQEQNCFITLTYAKSPIVLVKKDLQDFIKRLRKSIQPKKIQYFACGEYGEKKKRPHFHILIFGYDFEDKYEWSKSKSGHKIYQSEKLEKLWGHGLTTVQDMTINSASYSALYSSLPNRLLPKHLQGHREFNTMSQGLGVEKIMQRIDTYLETDTIWYDGKKYNIPQAVLNKKFKNKHNLQYELLKKARLDKSKVFRQAYEEKLGDYIYEQKRYKKENAFNRLTKTL